MKLLIADDLQSMHIVLQNALKDQNLGIDVILHAYNGHECLESIRRHAPDIMLLDMDMPVMSGQEVLKSLKPEEMPLVIVISAYDKFNYVHQALHSNVFDYLLKPINMASFNDIMNRAIKRCYNDIIEAIRYCLTSPEETAVPFALNRIDRFSIYLSYWMYTQRDKAAAPKLERALYLAAMSIGNNEYIMLHDASACPPSRLTEQITADLPRYNAFRIKISDLTLKQPSDLPERISQFRNDIGTFSFYFGDMPAADSNQFLLSYGEQAAQGLLEDITPENLSEYVDRLFSDIVRTSPNSMHFNREICNSLSELLKYAFDEYPLDVSEITNSSMDTVQELKKSFKFMLNTLINQNLEEETETFENFEDIETAKDYIDEHYMTDLSLNELSSVVFMSKFNLCRRFKQRYQIGIWNYIKQVRLSKACALLQNTDTKIYKIAVEVGFNDSSYFSNVFRSAYGMSPQAYRKQFRP